MIRKSGFHDFRQDRQSLAFSPPTPEQNCLRHCLAPTSQASGLRSRVLLPRLWPVDALEREKFKVILLIEPRTLEILQRKIRPSSKRERIDGQLDVSVLLFPRVGLVIENL